MLHRFESFVPKNMDREKSAIEKGFLPFTDKEKYLMSDDNLYRAAIFLYLRNREQQTWIAQFYPRGGEFDLILSDNFENVTLSHSKRNPFNLKFKSEDEIKKFSVRCAREMFHDLETKNSLPFGSEDKHNQSIILANRIFNVLKKDLL